MLPQFQDILDKSVEKGIFGGWLSISMNTEERPVMCLGQYEAIFKNNIFTRKMWNHKVKCLIVPKDEGYGIIISAFQSREFVFGYPLTVPYIQTINEYHALHPKYVNADASTTILGYNHKEPNKMGIHNFCQEFEYGTSAKVYWTYERTVLQIEYRTNKLKALYPGIYFIFLFDHPRGHERGGENRLNAMRMNSGYGGAQKEMHQTKIKQEVGYLGLHEKIIEVQDDNHMVFQDGGNEPLWMTPQERVSTKFSQYDEM